MKYPERDRKARRLIEAGEPYQGDRLAAALPFCRQRRVALDIGAHIGLWAVQLDPVFDIVHAFEPQPESFKALVENITGMFVTAYQQAVSDKSGPVWLADIGLAAHIADADTPQAVQVDAVRLDSLDLVDVDFVKIDVEGYETFVLRGGENTIRRDRPVIVLEQKHERRYGLRDRAALDLLRSWGASVEWRKKNDYCLRWK
jgi:FkbM family methyltransferase